MVQTIQPIEILEELKTEFPQLGIEHLLKRYEEMSQLGAEAMYDQFILDCLSFISIDEPDWTFAASRLLLKKLYTESGKNRECQPDDCYKHFYTLIERLTALGIYDQDLLDVYSKDEINELAQFIKKENDRLFTYLGLKMLADRYLARDKQKNLYELPQERFMIISMVLMKREPKGKRLELIKEAYWAMSGLYMTVATPTLANAGKTGDSFQAVSLRPLMTVLILYMTAIPILHHCLKMAGESEYI